MITGKESPVKIVGVMNALVALLAKEAGFEAIYLSGASLSSSMGMPDLGVLTVNDLVGAASSICAAVDLPLIVDIDNGWNHALLLERGGRELKACGAFAVQLEDQADIKRCGHLQVKCLVAQEEMCRKIELLKKTGIKVVARTDALQVEGIEATVARAKAYAACGADTLFLEAAVELEQIRAVKQAISIPVLINLTEFGKTPLWTKEVLKGLADFILYPMSVNRVMYQAAQEALRALKKGPSQEGLIPKMMPREELYKVIRYQEKEKLL